MNPPLRVRTVTVELTRRCHRSCPFCYVSRAGGGGGGCDDELDARELGRRVRVLLSETGCTRVQLSGGEPLLSRDLLGLVDELGGAARVGIITDGAHLDEEMARALHDRGVGPIQPTLLAGRAEEHDALRGPGSFRDATRCVATASRAGLPVVVSMVVTSKSWAGAGDVADVAFALGARRLALARFCPVGPAAEAFDELMPSCAQLYAATQSAAPRCRALGLPLSSVITIPACAWPDPGRPPLRTGVCSLLGPETTVTVGPDGGVRTCAMSSRTVGLLGETPWPELAGRLLEEELAPCREAVPSICRDCVYYPSCRGGCRLSALAAYGSLEAPDPLAPGIGRRPGA